MPEQLLTPAVLRVIPGWTYRSLIRNRVSIDQFSTYSKVRQFLSIEDLTEWAAFEQNVDGLYSRLSTPVHTTRGQLAPSVSVDKYFTNITDDERTEWQTNVEPAISRDSKVLDNVIDRLKSVNPLGEFEYKFVSTPTNLWLILNEGFGTRFQEKDYASTFYKAFLKELYILLPLSEVSKTWVYEWYLANMANSHSSV